MPRILADKHLHDASFSLNAETSSVTVTAITALLTMSATLYLFRKVIS